MIVHFKEERQFKIILLSAFGCIGSLLSNTIGDIKKTERYQE